jgi:hypothetical protein
MDASPKSARIWKENGKDLESMPDRTNTDEQLADFKREMQKFAAWVPNRGTLGGQRGSQPMR